MANNISVFKKFALTVTAALIAMSLFAFGDEFMRSTFGNKIRAQLFVSNFDLPIESKSLLINTGDEEDFRSVDDMFDQLLSEDIIDHAGFIILNDRGKPIESIRLELGFEADFVSVVSLGKRAYYRDIEYVDFYELMPSQELYIHVWDSIHLNNIYAYQKMKLYSSFSWTSPLMFLLGILTFFAAFAITLFNERQDDKQESSLQT